MSWLKLIGSIIGIAIAEVLKGLVKKNAHKAKDSKTDTSLRSRLRKRISDAKLRTAQDK